MSDNDKTSNETPAPKKDAGFRASIDGSLLTRFASIALLTSLALGGLVFMAMRSLASSADRALIEARESLGDEGVASVEALADHVSSTSSRMLLFIAGVAVVSVAIAVALSRSTAKKVIAPMVQLRDAARATSGSLPAFVQACEAGDGNVPGLPTVEVASGGIAADIAASFNEMQRNAANLAVTQTFRRTRDGSRFVNLGRSTEQLLNDQMRFIEAMEHEETSAANLQRLFRIDHLASRMRRNAASMLVLADRDTPREFNRPVSMHQVVQAASSGIEHFDRVSMSDLSGVAVNGAIAADLAHLLAELLETATSGSESITDVSGQATADGFVVAISDGDSALGPAELASINQSLTDPRIADATPRTAMTHAVIARLAKRHNVRVELHPSSEGGVITHVHLPAISLARLSGADSTPATPSAERSDIAVAAPPQISAEVPAPIESDHQAIDPAHEPALVSPPVADVVERVEAPADLPAEAPAEEPAEAMAAPALDPAAFPTADDVFASIVAAQEEPAVDASPAPEPAPMAGQAPTPAPVRATEPSSTVADPIPAAQASHDPAPASGDPAPASGDPDPASDDPAAAPADAEAASLAERWRVLASGQRAAIEWAMDVNSQAPSSLAEALQPGPVDAATLAQLDASARSER